MLHNTKSIQLQDANGDFVLQSGLDQPSYPDIVEWKEVLYARIGIQESTAIYRVATVYKERDDL